MNIQVVSVIVLLLLGLGALRIIWPDKGQAKDWRQLYESAMTENNSDMLKTLIYQAESAIQSRQKELRNEPSESPERKELADAATALVHLQSEKLRWPVGGTF